MTFDVSVAFGDDLFVQVQLAEKRYRFSRRYEEHETDPLSWMDFPDELFDGTWGRGVRILRGYQEDHLLSLRNFRTADDPAPEEISVNWAGGLWFVRCPPITDHIDLYVGDTFAARVVISERRYADFR